MKYPTAILLLVALGACASPRERCVSNALEEVRDVEQRIAVAEGNIARGYAIHVSEEPRASVGFCSGNRHGRVGVSTCIGTDNGPREQAVAIDVGEERRKVERLRSRLTEVQIALQSRVDQCAIYPDE